MSTPLRELLSDILLDLPTRNGFAADPAGFLQDHGWSDLDAADVQEALAVMVDDLPLEQAMLVAPAAAAVAADGNGFADAAEGLLAATSAIDPAALAAAPTDHTQELDDVDDIDGLDLAFGAHADDVGERAGDGVGAESDIDDHLEDDVVDTELDDLFAPDASPAEAPPDLAAAIEETADESFEGEHGAEDLADIDNPEDGDGVVEIGEFDAFGADVVPDPHGLDDLIDPIVHHTDAGPGDHHPHDAGHHDDLDLD